MRRREAGLSRGAARRMMQGMRRLLVVCIVLLASPLMADTVLEDFDPPGDWTFFTDQVMGGVSTGGAEIAVIEGRRALRLTGDVSTENRGGFIQARKDLPDGLPAGTEGIRLRVRGNGERYFVHLRTGGTVLPWQYYQAPFQTGADWTEVDIPLEAFDPSGALLRATPRPEGVRSIAVVAYGRDHEAEVSVARIEAY